jgi:glycosyltransferase involved in cell wall biosynthesis
LTLEDKLADSISPVEAPRKRRFLVFATEWFSGKGGLSTFNRELCEGLVRLECDVLCCVEAAEEEELAAASAKGVTLHCPDECKRWGREAFLLQPKPPLQSPRPFDFVIGHGRVTGKHARTFVKYYSPDSRRIHFIHVAPQCIEWHKGEDDAAQTAEARKREEAELVASADFAFGVGPLLRDEYQTIVRKATVYEFTPGLFDIERVEGPPPVSQCLVLGRAEDLTLKGLDIAATALGALNRAGIDCRLVVRGAPENKGNDLREELKAFDPDSPLDIQSFEYTSDRQRVLADVLESSLMLMPSRSEGFGLVALEAIAASVPVLASARSGLAKLLAKLLPHDPDAASAIVAVTENLPTDASTWQARIADVVSNRDLAFERAARLREKLATHLSWDDSIQDFLDVLSLGRGTPGRAPPRVPEHAQGGMETGLVALQATDQSALVGSEASPGPTTPRIDSELNAATADLRGARVHAAMERLERLLVLADANPAERRAILVVQAHAHLALEQVAEAEKCLNEANAADRSTAEGLASGAVAALLRGDTAAHTFAEQAVAADPRCERALTVLVDSAPEDVSTETLLKRVSSDGELASGPAAALAHRAHRRGSLGEAVAVARRAEQAASWPSPERKLHLGRMLLEAAASGEELEPPATPEEAASILGEAVEILEGGDQPRRLGTALSLLAMAHAMGGNEVAAGVASERSLELAPDDENVIFRRAAILTEREEFRDALEQLRRLPQASPEAQMLETEALYGLNRHDDALKLAELVDPAALPPQIVHQWVRVQLVILSTRQQWTRAKSQLARALTLQPTNVFLLTAAARLERQSGGDDQGALERAMQEIEHAPAGELEFLLSELVRRQAWTQAGEVMKRLKQVPGNATPLETEVWVAYNLGDLELALTLCRQRRSEGALRPDLVGMEASILEEIGALEDAATLLDEALESWSDHEHLWLRRSAVALRQRDRNTLDRCLAQLPTHFEDGDLNAQYVFQLVAADRLRAAANAAYEHRRARFNESEAHSTYVQTFLRLPPDLVEGPVEAGPGCAVRLRTEGASDVWWVLENAGKPDLGRRELDTASPLRGAIEGRRVGDKISVAGLGEIELCEIVSKYVHAFRESLNLFGSVLDDPSVRPVHIAGPAGFEPLFEAIRSQGERTTEVLALYDSGRITIGACASLLGVAQFEVAASMLNDPERVVRCTDGAPQSMAAAIAVLEKNPRLVCDPMTVVLLSSLRLGAVASARFGKLLVSQSLLDAAHQGLLAASELGGRTQMSLHYADGQYYRRENTPEEAHKARAFWEELLAFIGETCEVAPCWNALKIARQVRAEQAKLIDASSLDAVLLAKEAGRVLLSDDSMLRGLAGVEYGVPGVWTQSVMLSLQEGGQLDERSYAEATIRLVQARLAFVTINGEVLLVAAEQDGWAPGDEFRRIATLLAASNVEFSSAIAAVTDFIGRLWNASATDVRRDALLTVLFNFLSSGRQRRMVARGVERALGIRLRLAPTIVREATAILRSWEATGMA